MALNKKHIHNFIFPDSTKQKWEEQPGTMAGLGGMGVPL